MNQPNSQHIRNGVSRLRRLALLSAVCILILNAWMAFRITSVLDHGSATMINISGSQRTYSQRIRSDAFEIETAVRYGQWDKLEPLYEDLKQTTEHFSVAHQQLFTHRSPGELFGDATIHEADLVASIQVPAQQMISGSKELQKLTDNAIRRAPYIDELTINRILAVKDEITQAHSAYMPRMETIVDLFEQASRDEISASVRHARLAMVVLLVLLTATILFIIEPTILIIRRQLRDLDRATRHARRADAVRWRLLTNMGHEFRTPMNAVMGFAELLREDNLSAAERARLGQSIYESSKQLTHMIETMLDISAIESGQLRIVPTRCDLHRLLEGVKKNAQSFADEKELDLGFVIDESCPRYINTDTKRLGQILEKLTDNAVKFTESGRIDFSARFIAQPAPGVL
ncbi:MAG: histidine kinase dimerization/phospho-acceptor domain-containing protein [Phycisphaerales bacterium]